MFKISHTSSGNLYSGFLISVHDMLHIAILGLLLLLLLLLFLLVVVVVVVLVVVVVAMAALAVAPAVLRQLN